MRDRGVDQALALMRAQNEPGELVARSRDPVGSPPTSRVPTACHASTRPRCRGRIWPQSRGSQLAALVVGSRVGERVLDACAAPGGKATMLSGEVTAVELHAGRARELAANAGRLGAANVRVVNVDVRELAERGFDRALVDAPCSGLGVLAARPDLRWRSAPLPELQLDLLRSAADEARRCRRLLVCTLNADENEAVVDQAGLEPDVLAPEWPRFAHPKRPEFLLDAAPSRHVRLLHRPPPRLTARNGAAALVEASDESRACPAARRRRRRARCEADGRRRRRARRRGGRRGRPGRRPA